MAAVAENASGAASQERKLMHDGGLQLRGEVSELVELLSKLNPWAKEFVPSAHTKGPMMPMGNGGVLSADAPVFVATGSGERNGSYRDSSSDGSSGNGHRRRRGYGHGRRRVNDKVARAQREERIRRTVYVSDIDQHITEEQLAALFATCGQVLDCRVCGDPHSVLRFAFIEFGDEHSARTALNLSGTVLGYYPVRVLPSKTAILPVNPSFLPQSEGEKEICTRTVYCTNIEKKITQVDVKAFFESFCGEVSRLRLLGDHMHSTRIAFVEFVLISAKPEVTNGNPRGFNVSTSPYPGFPTDLQPQFMALLTTCTGSSMVEETVFENRMHHVNGLRRLGARIQVLGNRALVHGRDQGSSSSLLSSQVDATDLRGGASLILAGLAAEGTTEVAGVEHVDRGYHNLVTKLRNVGADVVRVCPRPVG